MKNRLIGTLIACLNLSALSAEFIPNNEYKDLYLYNCSLKNEVNICYPEREENPSDVIEKAQTSNLDLDPYVICEDLHAGDEQAISLCAAMMREESDERVCEIMYGEETAMYEICSGLSSSSDSLWESLDESLIKCEADYQESLRNRFSKEFPGINISFVSETGEIEYIHNAVFDDKLGSSRLSLAGGDWKNDILLLPEHKNNAFCNEDAAYSLSKLDKQVQRAEKLILDYHGDLIAPAVKILERPSEHIQIISTTCPEVKSEEEVKVIGQHKKKVAPRAKAEKVESKLAQSCASDEVLKMLVLHKQKVQERNASDYQSINPRKIPYMFAYFSGDIESLIDKLCADNGEHLEISAKTVKLNGVKVPSFSLPISFTEKINLTEVSEKARAFKDKINKIRGEEGIPPIEDATYIEEMMQAQSILSQMHNAIKQSDRVAKEGHHFALCSADQTFWEIEEGSYVTTCKDQGQLICMELNNGEMVDQDCNPVEFDFTPPTFPSMGPGDLGEEFDPMDPDFYEKIDHSLDIKDIEDFNPMDPGFYDSIEQSDEED